VTPPRVRAFTMRVVRRLADVVMTTGRALADEYPGAAELRERCVTVYPPVDPDEFAPDGARRQRARAELGVPPDAVVVGTIGNRNPTKGHDLLAEAIAEVRADGRDVWCRILGSDSPVHAREMAAVEARVAELGLSERLTITDPGTRVPELIHAFDVFALSSVPRSEGVPTVILEAMSCGLPVVATDVGAVREVVEEGLTGHVVPPLRPDLLADALVPLLDDPERREDFGRTARERVIDRYATERCADTYASAYELAVAYRASRVR
jgi:glycosyltransferase involved in cell wall biosynthesis